MRPIMIAGLLALAGCNSELSQSESDVTSCEGSYLDDAGTCRKPNGRFASRSCCVVPYAPKSRDLTAFTCPEGDDAIPVAFFDADSTLRISRVGAVTATEIDDVYVLPFAAEYIKKLNDDGMLVAIVSNQGGVSQGHETFEVSEGALVFAAGQLHELGARIDHIDLAEAYDQYRKPEPGMANRLDEELTQKCGVGIDKAKSFMVGDSGYKINVDGPHPDGRPADDFSNADRFFAENVGIPFSEPTDYFGWRKWEQYNFHKKEELVAFLDKLDAEIAELKASGDNPDLLTQLEAEVEGNRAINGL